MNLCESRDRHRSDGGEEAATPKWEADWEGTGVQHQRADETRESGWQVVSAMGLASVARKELVCVARQETAVRA